MSDSSEFLVLVEFDPFHRLLSAYNGDHFHNSDWRSISRSVIYALGTTLIMAMMLGWVVLLSWYLLDHTNNVKMFIIAVPVLVTSLQVQLTFIAMVMKNRSVTATIDQLQRAVGQRESRLFRIFRLSFI